MVVCVYECFMCLCVHECVCWCVPMFMFVLVFVFEFVFVFMIMFVVVSVCVLAIFRTFICVWLVVVECAHAHRDSISSIRRGVF